MRKPMNTSDERAAARVAAAESALAIAVARQHAVKALADAEAALADAVAANAIAQDAARHEAAFNGHDFWVVHSLMAVSEVTYANELDARRTYNAALAAVQ